MTIFYPPTMLLYKVQLVLLSCYVSFNMLGSSVTSKKSPNVYKSCPKMISLEKWKVLKPLQTLFKNVGDLGIIIFATGFEKLPKVQ